MATSPRPARVFIIIPSRCRWCSEKSRPHLKFVMPGLVPGIHAFAGEPDQRRGWPGIGERKRRRPSDGYGPAMTMWLDWVRRQPDRPNTRVGTALRLALGEILRES